MPIVAENSEVDADPPKPSDRYGDSGKQIAWNALGQDEIKKKLKDPESATFRYVAFHSGDGVPVTCGEVNAKNGFGGYTGYERFIAAGSSLQVLESEMGDGEMSKLWDKMCIG